MKRYLPAIGIVLFAAVLLLLLWLVTAPRKPLPVEAKPSPQAAAQNSQAAEPISASATEPSPVASVSAADAAPNEDLVPSPRRAGPAASTLADAAGPEVGPGLTPRIVLENMRGAVRDYAGRFGGNPFGINREIRSE